VAVGTVQPLSAELSDASFVAHRAITPVVLTFNEAPNIDRTLARLSWAKRVLVIDSLSTDATIDICSKYSNTTVITRTFDTFADQCNFALTQVTTPWVLSLDADYELSPELLHEIACVSPDDGVAGYQAGFVYRIFGHPLRSTLYPPRTVLYRRDRARYRNEGHGHRVEIDGSVKPLHGAIFHDDRKPLARWLASQAKYAKLEADHLLATDRQSLGLADKLRLMEWPAPILAGLYVLFFKGCILDGPAGWYYALQRVLAEILLALELLDRRLRQDGGS
jgi:glycosyltransferase involved in cell wall biosynthesis